MREDRVAAAGLGLALSGTGYLITTYWIGPPALVAIDVGATCLGVILIGIAIWPRKHGREAVLTEERLRQGKNLYYEASPAPSLHRVSRSFESPPFGFGFGRGFGHTSMRVKAPLWSLRPSHTDLLHSIGRLEVRSFPGVGIVTRTSSNLSTTRKPLVPRRRFHHNIHRRRRRFPRWRDGGDMPELRSREQ
jgi:hypothetical protein